MKQPVTLISFGYLHGQPPAGADFIEDLRPYRDPHVDPAMRQRTGRDQVVIDKVLATAGIAEVVNRLVLQGSFHANHASQPPTFAVGCAGGRHRSVVVADRAAATLRTLGYNVTVDHRDIDRPVVNR